MRLARLGASHPTRLSFMPALLRRIEQERWGFERRAWTLDARGVGHAVYTVTGPERAYSLVAFAHDLPDDQRSDRVIATAWDATFTLFDGVPSEADLARLAANVPHQEAGRVSDRELTLARANRSVRLWQHVVDALAQGQQPEADELMRVGYLMRTTAVYGSGKFGAAERSLNAHRPELSGPFRAEMLTVWLIRSFTLDAVEHMARQRGGDCAVALAPDLRRRLGVGNSTGLGMVPFLFHHPALLDRWITRREQALARVRALPDASAQARKDFTEAWQQACDNAAMWHSEHPLQVEKIKALREDLQRLGAHIEHHDWQAHRPWDALFQWGQAHLSLEGQEQLLALLLAPHGAWVDDLAEDMALDEGPSFDINGAMPLSELRSLVERDYAWALALDFAPDAARGRFWYVSEEKLEPRLGERHSEPGSDLELPVCTAEHVQRLHHTLLSSAHQHVADLLWQHPELRHAVRRVQLSAQHPYAEVQDNLLDAQLLPIDLLRAKLAFFGATQFDPRSDRWVRITMYANSPLPSDICDARHDGGLPESSAANGQHAHAAASVTTRYSLPEISALSKRAARGAGMDWGLAEEAAHAVRWLHAHGVDGASALADLLQQLDGQAYDRVCPQPLDEARWHAAGHSLCAIAAGCAWADHAGLRAPQALHLSAVVQVPLLLPFVARAAARAQQAWCLQSGDQTWHISAEGMVSGDAPDVPSTSQPAPVTLRPSSGPATQAPWTSSALSSPVAPQVWHSLQAFAQRTLVPADARSRAAAGSALSDND
jgi:hypothetical protein